MQHLETQDTRLTPLPKPLCFGVNFVTEFPMSIGRIAQLKARIAERDGKPGYTRNVAALKAELAKLSAVKPSDPPADPKD